MKKAVGFILLALLLAFGVFAGCSEEEQEPETTITMQESMELTIFETGLLTAQVSTGETAAFTSSDEKVVTVAENGAVTPQGAGEAVITAAAGGAEATCRVTVTVPENAVIRTVTDASLKLNVGASLAITHYAMYGEQELEGGAFTFTSSDKSVASVSADGEVTGVKKGEAQITVGGSWKGVSLQESTVGVAVSDQIVFTLNQNDITLKRADDLISEGLESTFALEPTVLLNGAEVSDPVIEVSVEPAGVVTVEDLLITAVSSGTAKLTLRYTSPEGSLATATAEVTVVRPVTAVPMGEAAEQGINRTYTYSNAVLEGADIVSATYGEENVAASVEGTQLSVSFAGIKADGSAHTLTVTAQTATDEYVFTRELRAVDFMIGTTEEFNAFISALADTSQYWYAELTDNIDFTGKELTRKMDDASRASASFSLDGNGYWVGNLYMEDTNTRDKAGIFGDVYASAQRTVLQNIAFIGIRNHSSGGLFVNLQNADLTDMYIEVEAHNFLGGGIGYSTDNVKLTNVVLHTTYVNKSGGALTTDADGDYTSALGNKFGAVSVSAAGAEDTNVYAISNAAYVYGSGQKNPANLFASAAEMREAVNTVPAGFNTEYWTADHGILIFKSVQDMLLPSMTLNITSQTETVNLLDSFTFAADRDAVWSVSGLESGEYTLEGGILTVTSESAVGKTFTMTATYIHPQYGIAVTAQTGSITVQNEKEQASEDLGEFAFAKNRAVTVPVEVTLAEGEQVRSLLDGETPAEAPQAQDGKVVFGTEFFAAQASGMHTYTLQVESMTKVTSYTFAVYLLDYKIGTTEEFEAFAASVKAEGEGMILAELDKDIDYTGKTFTAFGSAVKRAYTLDGKGHYINGISSPSDGIFGNISTGQVNGRVTLRNIAITNISNPGAPAGIFSNGYNVELCDVFISYATVMGNDFTAPAVFAPVNATLKNVVVVAQVDPSKDIGAISKAGETATTQYVNCYAVSNATYLYPDAPDTSTLFADVAAMKAAVTGVPEGFNTEYWTQAASGLLTFKSVDALYDVTDTLQMTQAAVEAEERTEITISFGMPFTAAAGTLANPYAINQHQNFNYAGDSLMNYILIGDGQTQRSAYEICTDNANGTTSYQPGAGWMSMGGIWAPVLVQVPADGSGIKVSVYTGYLAEGAFTVTLKAGWSWNTANGMTMRVTEDVAFGWQNGQFERI